MICEKNAPRLLGAMFPISQLQYPTSRHRCSGPRWRTLSTASASSLFGAVAVSVSLVGMAFQLFGQIVPIFVSLPIGLFELVIGLWLLARGIPGWSEMAAT
jgi:hypothetical protein